MPIPWLQPANPATPWNAASAAHLLRRTQFGFTASELQQALTAGREQTVDRLLAEPQETPTFLAIDTQLRQTALATGNLSDLQVWWLYRLLYSAGGLREKLTVMWHNHFATSFEKVRSAPQMLAQNDLFRAGAWGSFRDLLHAVSRDPAMLVWLDGNSNRRRQPNENFAREVMELFSLGVGNYTERDIQEAARAFSGWQLRDGQFWINENQRDFAEKSLFGQTGNFTGRDVVDLCLAQPACPRFIAARLIHTFVIPQPADDQITAVADRLTAHSLEIRPVLRELLLSSWFDSAEVRAGMIKSPLDFVLGTLRSLAVEIKWQPVAKMLADLGQAVFAPPSVKGWEGHRLWITSASLIQRLNFITELVAGSRYGRLAPDLPQQLRTADDRLTFATEHLLGDVQPTSPIHSELQTLATQQTAPALFLQTTMSLPEYQLM